MALDAGCRPPVEGGGPGAAEAGLWAGASPRGRWVGTHWQGPGRWPQQAIFAVCRLEAPHPRPRCLSASTSPTGCQAVGGAALGL